MKKQILFNLFVALAMLASLAPAPLGVSAAPQAVPGIEVEPALLAQLDADGSAGYLIYFREQPDLSPAYKMDWNDRGRFVMQALQATAEKSQVFVRAYLNARGVKYQAFWIDNVIVVEESNRATFNGLMSFSEIKALRAERHPFFYEPVDVNPDVRSPNAVESNLTHVKADQVWGLGYTGQDIVVANIDTGVRYTHQALVNHYRGNLGGGTFDHNYNWYDPYDHSTAPNDPDTTSPAHGTHTMGTMIGDDGGTNQIGMAPGAEWIACQGFNPSATDAGLLACGQFMAAPTDLSGNNPNPDLRPNIVNNSWGDCGNPSTYDPWYEGVVSSWNAAGVYPLFANGNQRSTCPVYLGQVGNPARYAHVMGVGALGRNNGALASYSLWGPTDQVDDWNPLGYPDLKPQVSAPGTNRSALGTGDTGYQDMSGTSMSTPHVAGLVALMWSAAPCLIGDYIQTETIIQQTAMPTTWPGYPGSPSDGPGGVPNQATGWGEIDALAAVQAVMGICGPHGTLTGAVTDSSTGDPIEGANVNAVGLIPPHHGNTTTGAGGMYTMMLPVDSYYVTAAAYGYVPETAFTSVLSDTTTTQNFALDPAQMYMVQGTVTDANTGWPLYARIDIAGYPGGAIWTDPVDGDYSISLQADMTYTFDVQAWVPGYLAESRDVYVDGNKTEDYALDVDQVSCNAPGYYFSGVYFEENFDSLTPPALGDWATVVVTATGSPVWATRVGTRYPSGQPAHSVPNLAFFNSFSVSSGGAARLYRTSGLDMTTFSLYSLSLWMYHDTGYTGNNDRVQVQVSTDSGASWQDVGTPISRYNGSVGWAQHTIDLSAYSAQTDLRLGFLGISAYGNDTHIDDIFMGDTPVCTFTSGGLVVGNVYDDNTNAPLNGAAVENEDGYVASTISTPGDPAVDDGFYTLFSPDGTKTFTATLAGYGADAQAVTVVQSDTVGLEPFYLAAGWLSATPSGLHATLNMNDSVSQTLTLENQGGAAAYYELVEMDRGWEPLVAMSPYVPPRASDKQPSSLLQSGQSNVTIDENITLPAQPEQEILLNQAPNQVNGLFSDSGCGACTTGQQSIAENFSLSAGKAIGQIVFWTGYHPGDVEIDPDQITVIFHADAAGSPGAAIYTESNVAYERFETGVVIFGVHEWQHTLTLGSPVNLPPGNYWVEIYNNTAGSSENFFWETGVLDPINGLAGSGWATATPGSTWNYDSATNLSIQLIEAAGDVPWLSETPISGTVAAPGSQVVDVSFDAGVPEVTLPGDYYATLRVNNNTPYGALYVPVTMTVLPLATWGKLQGTVTGLGYCDVNPAPLEGAEVFVEGAGGVTWTLTTDVSGTYSVWIDQADSPLTVTVTAPMHELGQASGVIVSGQSTTTQNFGLRYLAPCVSVTPDSLHATVYLGSTAADAFDISNDGAADTDFEIKEQDRGFVPLLAGYVQVGPVAFTPAAAVGPMSARSLEGQAALGESQPGQPLAWANGAAMPAGDGVIRYAHAQCAESPDSFYVVSGVNQAFSVNAKAWRYDANTNTWNALAAIPTGQEGPSAVCYEGKLYVLGGGGTTQFYIYTIASNTWAAGLALPRGMWGAAVGAWDGKVYMIGGDNDFTFGGTSNQVNIYDIASGTWSVGAPMPTAAVTAGWVQAGPYMYLAGGWDDASPGSNLNVTQRYDMSANTWTTGPTFTGARADMGLAITEQNLYAISGDANGGGAFDPTTAVDRLDWTAWPGGSWASLGDPLPVARTAVNSNFCTEAMAGGEVWALNGATTPFPTFVSANSYRPSEPCFVSITDVPWLSEAPITGTLTADGGQQTVDVAFDAGVPEVTQPGDYYATLNVKTDDANSPHNVVVTMTVLPPLTWGKLAGTVTGLGYCDANPAPLEGAEVFVEGATGVTWTLTTDANGYYSTWVDETYSPLTVTVTALEHETGTADGVLITGTVTTTVNFDLRYLAPCVDVTPQSMEVTLDLGMTTTLPMDISNDGAVDTDFGIKEQDRGFMPAALSVPATSKPVTVMRLADGSVDCKAYENYIGVELAEVGASCGQPAAPAQTYGVLAPTDIGFAQDIGYVSDNFVSFTLNNFSGQTVLGTSTNAYYGMDFDPSATILYALNDTTDQLGTINLTNGAFTPLVACPPGGGADNWTGLSIAADGTFYASTATDLYIINPATGASTLIGPFGTTLMIEIAINAQGQMYGHDIGTDSIYSIDLATGAATLIGLTGYAANYAQGMDFDNGDGTLYIFLYQGSGANVFGTVDLTTGAVTPLAVSSPQGEFEGAVQVASTADVPWVSEDPISGTLPADVGQQTVDVTFDAGAVSQPGQYYATLQVKTDDPTAGTIGVVVTMNVNIPASWGKVEGLITDNCTGDPVEATITIAGGDPITMTTSDPSTGYYAAWLDSTASPFDITYDAAGYISQTINTAIAAGDRLTQNVVLIPARPCLELAAPAAYEVWLITGTLVYTDPVTIDLTNNGGADLDYVVTDQDKGFVTTTLLLAGEDVLVVAYDTTAAAAMETALTALGYTYLQVDQTTFQGMVVADLLEYQAVFYAGSYSGDSWAKAIEYMDNGGSFYISDNDLGYGSGSTVFYQTYLQATYVSDDPSIDTLIGENIMAGVNPNIAADLYPDDFTVGAEGARVFQFTGGNAAGVAVERNDYKAIYTSFDFYNIASAADGQAVIERVMKYLAPQVDAPWVWEAPISGTVPALGGSASVEVAFTTFYTDMVTPMPLGVYTAVLKLEHNDPTMGAYKATVVMHIIDEFITATASFESNAPVCFGETVVFTNTSQGVPEPTYLWSFGDGVTSTLKNPTHDYATAGSYNVTLEACNSLDCDTYTDGVEVIALPEANFSYVLDQARTVTFTNTSVGADSYLWHFGDGDTSTETNPVHTYAATGPYLVTLFAYGDCGTDYAQVQVDVVQFYAVNMAMAGAGSGVITPSVGLHMEPAGAVMQVVAVADLGSYFDGWSGSVVTTTNPMNIVVNGEMWLTATFMLEEYTLDTNVVGSGAVGVDPGQATYNYGDVVTLTATPDAGWSFAGWNGDLSGMTNPAALTMDENKVVTATFSQLPTYTLTVVITPTGAGSVALLPTGGVYLAGTVVTLTVTPAAGWQFVGWSGDLTGTANPATLTMDGNKTVTAMFEQVITEYKLFLPIVMKNH